MNAGQVVLLYDGPKAESAILRPDSSRLEPILSVEYPEGSSASGIVRLKNLVLEGFRPGRLVRIRPQVWPKIKPPVEEQIRSLEDRWPSPDIFKK